MTGVGSIKITSGASAVVAGAAVVAAAVADRWHSAVADRGAPPTAAVLVRRRSQLQLLADALRASGLTVEHEHFFDTVTVVTDASAEEVRRQAHERGIHLGTNGPDQVRVAVSEVTTRTHLLAVLEAFGADVGGVDIDALDASAADSIPSELHRTTRYIRLMKKYQELTLRRWKKKDHAYSSK